MSRQAYDATPSTGRFTSMNILKSVSALMRFGRDR